MPVTRSSRPRRHRSLRLAGVLAAVMLAILGLLLGHSPIPVVAGTTSNLFVIAGSGLTSSPPGSSGTLSTSVGYVTPSGIADDANGNVIVADSGNNEVDLVVRGSASAYSINGVASPLSGYTYVLAGGGSTPASSAGTVATSTQLNGPNAVALDGSGNVVIADTSNNEIDVLAESSSNPGYTISGSWIVGDLYLIAGGGNVGTPTVGGVVGTSATLSLPKAVAIDSSGNVVIADSSNGEVDLLALHGNGSGRTAGDVYVIAGGGTAGQATTSGLGATTVQLNFPSGLAIDAHGNIAIADTNHNTVVLLAESTTDPGYGIGSSWTAGDAYRILGGSSTAPSTSGVAAGQSQLSSPQGLAFDKSGDLLVADASHHAVEVLALTGTNPGFALGSGATWNNGDIYVVAGEGTSSVSASGTTANQSQLFAPTGVAQAPDGSVDVIDQSSYFLLRMSLSPSLPTALSGTAGDASASLRWTAPASNGGSAITDYIVYVYDHGQSIAIKTIDTGSTGTSFDVTGLSDGTTFDLTVSAENAIGLGTASSLVSVTPVAPVTTTTSTTTTSTTTTSTTTTSTTTTTTVPRVTTTTSVTVAPPTTTTTIAVGPGPVKRAPAAFVPRLSMVISRENISAAGFVVGVRCNVGTCRGALTVTARTISNLAFGSGNIQVIKESVIARAIYRDTSGARRVIHARLTSYGKRLVASMSRKGLVVVITASTRGSRAVSKRLRVFSSRRKRNPA